MQRAVGDQLTCVFVAKGLLRRAEPERVVATFEKHMAIRLVHVDAAGRFLDTLAGVADPGTQRRRIGETFIRVCEEEAGKLGRFDVICQGTTYPDVIESAPRSGEAKAAVKIKTHHNVGGLPSDMTFRLVEPLRYLFKDEVRQVGIALGLPEAMVYRQPSPGPGLAIRLLGAVTREKPANPRAADRIVPGLSENLVFCDLGTPLTNDTYVPATRANIYGTEKSIWQIGPGSYPVKTEIPGLLLCGASTVSHGVMGATLPGLIAAKTQLGCRVRDLLVQDGPPLVSGPCDAQASALVGARG